MNKDDRAFKQALRLLDYSLEYFVYFSLINDIPREEYISDLRELVLNTLNYTEQEYYYDEDDELQAPEYIDELRTFMLDCRKITTE